MSFRFPLTRIIDPKIQRSKDPEISLSDKHTKITYLGLVGNIADQEPRIAVRRLGVEAVQNVARLGRLKQREHKRVIL